MFAIAEIAGKQHKVQKGDILKVEKLKDSKEGDKVKVDKVLLKSDSGKTDIGTPYVSGSAVELTVKAHGKHDKIKVFKKKPKKRYERTYGHRQHYTEIEITAVK
ncbi:50S ribosomal protein L21 [Patescibacteria group bacterium]|nr:50S ribosomal protein L21 [Patescibacteria group bacterium]